MFSIFSDKKQDYMDFIADSLSNMEKFNVTGIAIVVLTDNGQSLTGYWNMDLKSKAEAKNNIEYDVIDGIVMANKDRYFENDDEEL